LTATVFVIVVEPEVAVTVIFAIPFGVPPVSVPPGLDPPPPQPKIVAARTTTAAVPHARRRLGFGLRQANKLPMPVRRLANPSKPRNPGVAIGGRRISTDAEGAWVENVICTCDPLGGGPGANGLGVKVHDEFAGRPEHDIVNERFEPGAANIVSAKVTLCPTATVGIVAGDGPNSAAFTASLVDADVLAAKMELHEYCALIECEPTESEDVLKIAWPLLTAPVPT
jgi:hypothetical protein